MRGLRSPQLLLLLLPALASGHVVQRGSQQTDTPPSGSQTPHIIASPSLPRVEAHSPLQTPVDSPHKQLDLRQAAAPADPNAVVNPNSPANPASNPEANPAVAPADLPINPGVANPGINPNPGAQPAAPTSSSSSISLITSLTSSSPTITTIPTITAASTTLAPAPPDGSLTDSLSIIVQWVETHITQPSSTSTTWIPITVTMRFAAAPDPWAEPVDGKIGYATVSQAAPVAVSTGAGSQVEPAGGSVGLMGAVAGAMGAGIFGLWG